MENENYSDNLVLSFQIILSQQELQPYMQEICELIIDKTISRQKIESVLKEYDINKKEAQKEFLDLILYYIEIALKDGVLTIKEKENILFLKKLFKIEEKSFYKFKKQEIAEILKVQLQRIYLNDLKIDNSETLFKVDLQEIFNLGYDEFLEFVNEEAIVALEQGAKIEDLDTFIKDYKSIEEPHNENEQTENEMLSFDEKYENWKKSTNHFDNNNINSGNNSLFETPNYIFWFEILVVSFLVYSKTDNVWLGIGSFILLGFIIHIKAIIFLIAIAMSFFVAKFAFDFVGIFFGETVQWIISIVLFIILFGKHYSNNDLKVQSSRSRQIPSSVKKQVWERDGGRCVICGSTEDLEYDHDLPFSKGGSNSVNNIRLLCRKCNRSKTNKIE